MKLTAKLLLIPAFFCTIVAGAQTVESTANDIKWSLLPTWNSNDILKVTAKNSAGSPYTEGISTGVIKIDDNSVIANVQLDKDNYGVVRLNKDMTTQWLSAVDGFPVAIGMFQNNVLVICTGSVSTLKGSSNNYTGFLIDKKTGNVILKKSLYTPGDDFYEQHVFLISADGAYFKMAVRTSTLTKKSHFGLAFSQNKAADAFFETSEFKILDFDKNLELSNTVKPVLETGEFIGATINNYGDVFLMTNYGQGITKIARYEGNKTTPAKVLQVPVSMSDKEIDNLKDDYILTSKSDPLIIFYTAMYPDGNKDKELIVAKFNFKDGTVVNNIQVMDKPYLKDMEKSYVPFSKKFDDVDFGMRDEMHINNVLENDGKLIVSLSSHTEQMANAAIGTSGSFTARAVIINMYDNKMNMQYQQIIPRKYTMFASAYYIGANLHCDNNSLYITLNNNKGLNGNKALFGQIDLKTGAITNIVFIPKDHIKDWYAINPDATLWFGNKFIINYIQEKGWFDSSEDAHMQLISF